MDYYLEIKSRLLDNEIYSRAKDYSKERHRIITYFETGKLLFEAGSKYGDKIIDQYSLRLTSELGHQYNKSTLFKMRKLYLTFKDEKVAPLVPQLTWSHNLLLLPLEEHKIIYYSHQIIQRNLSKRQLMDIIKNKEYERLPE